MDMRQCWNTLGAELKLRDAEAVYTDLVQRLSEPHRVYHTLSHVQAMLKLLAAQAVPERATVELAVWFHDAVYDSPEPAGPGNEERSARLLQVTLQPLGVSAAVLEHAASLILATRQHAPSQDPACRWLLDADLAILGADESCYDAYARAIRLEYLWVPEDAYRAGRRRVLQAFLNRGQLFQTGELSARLEASARANLHRELHALGETGE